MPLIKPFRSIPTTVREWDAFFRGLQVIPDSNTIESDQLQDDSVSNTKLRNSGALSVIGRASDVVGDPADISATVDNTFLVRRATVLGFGPLLDADIPATIARDTEVSAAVTAHEAAGDPHTGYLLEAGAVAALEGDDWTFSGEVTVTGTFAVFGATAVGQQAHIADAVTSHDINSTFSDTEVEAALNALGSKINEVLALVETYGFTATS